MVPTRRLVPRQQKTVAAPLNSAKASNLRCVARATATVLAAGFFLPGCSVSSGQAKVVSSLAPYTCKNVVVGSSFFYFQIAYLISMTIFLVGNILAKHNLVSRGLHKFDAVCEEILTVIGSSFLFMLQAAQPVSGQ